MVDAVSNNSANISQLMVWFQQQQAALNAVNANSTGSKPSSYSASTTPVTAPGTNILQDLAAAIQQARGQQA